VADSENRELLRRWIDAWKQAGPELERMRVADMRRQHLPTTIPLLDELLRAALEANPPVPTSGLVEMQRWFIRLATAAP